MTKPSIPNRDRTPAIPTIPPRYAAQLLQARQAGYLAYTDERGQGRVLKLWSALCKAEQRPIITVHNADPRGVTISLDIRHDNAIFTNIKAIRAIFTEHCSTGTLVRCEPTFAVAFPVPHDVAPIVTSAIIRLAGVLTAVAPC